MSGSAASLTGARCGQHPDAAAVALCARCGGYLCGACTEVLKETAYCAPCAERRFQDMRPSRAVRLALLANVLGLLLLVAPLWMFSGGRQGEGTTVLLALMGAFAAAVAGTVISTRKLRRRDEVGDRGFAIVLRVLSALNLLGLLAWGALIALVLTTLRRHGP
ncbi:hypothetical protein HJC10_11900 [Corallococcus exiguus]|uniref:hypothetical protein n=1 Tax=Corallococcus TaxID=83461 RepID=UPI000EDE39F6|nr:MULTISPECIES: hypothetical protein [Corallococcus]NNB94872.1 hypothetical protein [Corallococcus exiguus]NNC03544.1 hypothetical protein [Corallococcus exiguus]NPC47294.1 hypothetical protein [Corallococcus exiguus]RKH77293.1 hypothetical protein D7X99_32075 [Corallococcus sp. AB032C]